MILLTLLLWTALCQIAELVIVRVEQGSLRGELRNRSTGNGQFCSFKGIPYAAPPTGELRFKAPQPALKWDGVRNATEHGPVCPQINIDNGDITGSEDCLFLNVYTTTMNPNASLPVMFYIFGGGFVSGSGNDDKYGPDFLLDHNVVVVTINYRLGALGFLSLDIKEAPGNAGLKDQVQALRWVKTNIDKFGGDPNKVTIFGSSVGGASVSLHALSPMSKGLFKHAIATSGVGFSDFVVDFEHKRLAFLLAHKIGLYTENPQEAFKFLRNASVKDLVITVPNVRAYDEIKYDALKFYVFPPVVEKQFGDQHFMTEPPEKLLLEGKTNIKEMIFGYTSQEGITRAVSQKEYIFKFYPYFKELLVPANITTQLNPKQVLQLADCIKNHYFGDKVISEANMKMFIRFFSYTVFVVDVHRYLEMWIKGGNRAYLYQFSCFSERNVNGLTGLKYGVKGAGHLDDPMYIFYGNKYNIPLNKTSPSYKMIVQYCSLFTNYGKYGNPTPDRSLGAKWDYYNKNQTMLNVDLNLTSQRTPMSEINYWRRLYQSVGVKFS